MPKLRPTASHSTWTKREDTMDASLAPGLLSGARFAPSRVDNGTGHFEKGPSLSAGNRIRCIASCRNWNEVFPIGTEVLFEGRTVKTWSLAGIGARDEPSVFLEGIDEPVPISRLEAPGWERSTRKSKGKPS